MNKYHVIIDPREINNLRVIDHAEYIMNNDTIIEIFNGSEFQCNEFSNHYNHEIFYPLVDQEELC